MNPIRIAMWSGPRNISTAMMRAFENRPDCAVWDEPLYGPYLYDTGKDHPGAKEVIAAQGSDRRGIIAAMLGPAPGGAPIFYQKHMTHHVLPGVTLDWLDGFANCFLIRDPVEAAASYALRRARFDASDLGVHQQLRLFRRVCERNGAIPPVIEGRDVLADPRRALTALCVKLGIDFDEAMLHWPSGARSSDGVWGKYWYDGVWASTGFKPYTPKPLALDAAARRVADECRPCYEELRRHRLRFD